jgi:T5SS/PEP-CTERM-associated repeat protein
MTGHPSTLTRIDAALACALLCVSLPALATDTKSSGDWLDNANWTQGVPGPADGAVVKGHAMTLEDITRAAALTMDGSLDVRGADAPATNFGSFTVGNQVIGDTGTAELRLSKGGRVLSGSTYLGFRPGSSGFVSINGEPSWQGERSSWTNTGELFVGSSGFGPAKGGVSAVNGATVNTYNTTIGSGVSAGAVEINNATWTNTNLFRVGSGGTQAKLTVGAGGVLNSLTGVIGYGSGSTSALTNTLGTAEIDNGSWSNSGDFHVGWYARGTLAVRNRGVLDDTIGTIGYAETAIGDVTISNSTWTNRGALNVGYNGQGTLLVTQGSTVTNTVAILGAYGSAAGKVTVDDAAWTSSGELYVGYGLPGTGSGARGTLTVRNGGVVSATNALIAHVAGSSGDVTVSGANGGGRASQWNLSGALYVGNAGHGTLTVDGGGIVRSGSTFLGYQGEGKLFLRGGGGGAGTLETAQLSGGTGAGPQNGAVSFDGGLLRATADQADFVRNIGVVTVDSGGAYIDSNGHRIGTGSGFVGSGGVHKVGLGTLDLRGISFLGGLSTVQAGTLLVNGGLSGNVEVQSGGTLGGGGRIDGVVTVLPGGTLSPGNSPGTLTVASLAMQAGAALAIELGAPGDLLVVLGDVALNGRIDFSGDASSLGGASFLSYGGTLVDAGIVIGSLPGGLDPHAYVLDFSTPGMLGVMQAVPEPATATLMALGALLLALSGRQRLAASQRRLRWRAPQEA